MDKIIYSPLYVTESQALFLCCFFVGQSVNAQNDADTQRLSLENHLSIYRQLSPEQKKQVEETVNMMDGMSREEMVNRAIQFMKKTNDQ